VTAWQPGSTMTWVQRGLPIGDPAQVVLAAEAYRRLSYMWHSFTPGLSEALDLSDKARERIAREPRSRAMFDIELSASASSSRSSTTVSRPVASW
jgi:hypothetical protein